MKKITLVIFVFLLSFTGHSQLSLEGFEGTWTNNQGPAGWSIINVAGPVITWRQATQGNATPVYNGTRAAYLNKETVATGTFTEDWLITPLFNIPANAEIKFYSRLTDQGDQGNRYRIMIGTDPADRTTFTQLKEFTEATISSDVNVLEYEEIVESIPASYANQNYCIAFVMLGNNGDRWLIDDVSVLGECITPTGLTAENVTASSAQLSWGAAGTTGNWEIEVIGGSETPTRSGELFQGALPYQATNLQPNTIYKYYVRTVCQPAGNFSNWAGPFYFSSQQTPATLNWSTDFETSQIGFTIVNGNQTNKWVYGDGVSNSPSHSMYISNDGGATNAYTHNATSVVHFYRDVVIPEGATEMNISFDWRNAGENGADDIRIFITPDTYTPNPGAVISTTGGRIRVGNDLIGNSEWTRFSHTTDVTSYANTTRRIVFQWRNNNTGGNNPAGAIDNVSFSLVTCSQPANLQASNPTSSGVRLNWTNQGTATSWEVYTAPQGSPAPTETTEGDIVSTNPYTVSGLEDGIFYVAYVRSVCSDGMSLWTGPVTFFTPQEPSSLDYTNDFETRNGFTLVNGSQRNKWVYGDAVSSSPSHSLYISSDGGLSNAYDNTVTTTVMAYKDIIIPPGTLDVTVDFDWKGSGESCCDYLQAWIVPSNYAIVPGTDITPVANRFQIPGPNGGNFNGVTGTDWTHFHYVFDALSRANSTVRLVFVWHNDNQAGQNPAAVDNVEIKLVPCPQPRNLVASPITTTSANLSWTSAANVTTWEVYLVPYGQAEPTDTTEGVIVTQLPYVPNLTDSSMYTYYVRSVCGEGEHSIWSGPVHFTTLQVPVTLPYEQDFETRNGFTFLNGTGANKWVYGTATSNSPTHSIYVSNDNGVSNAYTGTEASTIVAYRDFAIPSGTVELDINFDWKAMGEEGSDYFNVWAVPLSYNLVQGTPITTGTGRNRIMGPNNGAFNLTTDWTHFQTMFDQLTPYAGGVMRLVFEWRNNSNGSNEAPPAAIDNVNVSVISCNTPLITSVTATDATQTTAVLNWTPRGSATSWELYVVPAEDGAPTEDSEGIVVTEHPYTIQNLIPGTNYVFYIRAYCGEDNQGIWVGPISFGTLRAPASLDYTQDFETENDFTFANNRQTNIWAYGTATSSSATHSLYVSNDQGVSNAYSNTSSTVAAYREIIIPQDILKFAVAFDWKSLGDSSDLMNVWVVPATYNVVPGTPITNGTGRFRLPGNFYGSADWKPYWYEVDPAAYAGSNIKLVFEWRNNNANNTPPPAAVDNINVSIVTCPQPTALTVVSTDFFEATVSWTNNGPATSWEVFAVPAGSAPPTEATEGTIVNSTTHTFTELEGYTNYDFYVRAICGPDDISHWSGPGAFRTKDPCPPPPENRIGVICITENGATFVWQAGLNETSWEVAVVPRNAEVPASGTVVTAPEYYIDNLPTNSEYTFYVRSVCVLTEGYSEWTHADFITSEESVGSSKPLCAGLLAVPQPSHSGGPNAYGSVGCLSTTPNPSWYYVTLNGDDEVVLNLSQINVGGVGIDVDFAAFGPFTSIQEACRLIGYPLNTDYIVDCSYSADSIETINLDGNPGDVYALLITNYDGDPGSITIDQTDGTPISCDPTVYVGVDRVLCNTSSYNINAIVNNPGVPQVYTYTWTMDGQPYTPTVVSTGESSQTIQVTEPGEHIYSVVVTMPQPTSPEPVTDQVTVALSAPFTVPTPQPLEVCAAGSTGTLDISDVDFLGALDPEKYRVSGVFRNISDANTLTNPIDITQPFSVTAQTLYVVVEDIDVPECRKVVPLVITLNTSSAASISYDQPSYCNDTAQVPVIHEGTTGGTYSAVPQGLVIDATTGAIDPSQSEGGLYTVVYTIPATTTCPELTATVQVRIVEQAQPTTIVYSGTYCNSGTATVTLTGTSGGTFTSDDDLVINAETGEIDLAASALGLHTITYTVPASGNCAGVTATAEIQINEAFTAAISYEGSPYCSDAGVATVTFTGTTGGTYSGTEGLSVDAATGEINLAASSGGEHLVTYTIPASNGCSEVIATAVVVINKLLVADFQYQYPSVCTNAESLSPIFVGGGVAGTFMADRAGLAIDPLTGAIDPAASQEGSYTVTNTIAATGSCPEVTATQVITILPAPVADFSYDATAYCKNGNDIPTPELDGLAGTFTSSPAGLVIDAATGIIDLDESQPGVYNVTNTISGTADCPAVAHTETVTIVALPELTVTQGCVDSRYTLELLLDNDPVNSIDNVTIAWYKDAPSGTPLGSGETQIITEGGTYYVVVTPTDGNSCGVTQEVPVTDTVCNVPRGISPGGTLGQNDTFDLTGYGVTKLVVFNRYGQEVYSFSGNYTNQWGGNGNNGDELPTGAYFYMLERSTGENKTGWVYINRQNN